MERLRAYNLDQYTIYIYPPDRRGHIAIMRRLGKYRFIITSSHTGACTCDHAPVNFTQYRVELSELLL